MFFWMEKYPHICSLPQTPSPQWGWGPQGAFLVPLGLASWAKLDPPFLSKSRVDGELVCIQMQMFVRDFFNTPHFVCPAFSQIFTPCGPHSSFRNSYLAPLTRSLHFLEGHRLPEASSQEIIVMFRRCFIFFLVMVPPLYDTTPPILLSGILGGLRSCLGVCQKGVRNLVV